ncbi:MAG: phosphoadenylyl-sulfate reductase [Rhodospirillaceae bacterium]|nr:phosphoadenylyl-sulfate reductase [Rhodospirillaceae bacterium]
MTATTIAKDKTDQVVRRLRNIARDHAPSALASSFGVEDMVLTDLIDREALDIGIFTLDTGRLPEETYRLMQEVRTRYRVRIVPYFPRGDAVESYVAVNGPNAFFDSVALRKACCNIRKVEPLRRALAGKASWITGQRRQHSPTRRDLPFEERDEDNRLQKFNPLADWTNEEIWTYVKERGVPYNALHDRFYASIGCAPCTRAIAVGEDIRAGRWWWEDSETKECGLHSANLTRPKS